jgi:predicted cupin superfamily sugar epimerase
MNGKNMASPEDIINHYGLKPLPVEGGLFYQTYLAAETITKAHLPERYPADKPFGTAIVAMMTSDPDSFSALHRLPTDEVYHFYLGDPIELLQLYPGGSSKRIILGQDILKGQQIQYLAPRGVWQGSHLLPGGDFALFGTTMAPGFTEEDYYGGDREELIKQYPKEAELICQLTRPHESRRRMPSID